MSKINKFSVEELLKQNEENCSRVSSNSPINSIDFGTNLYFEYANGSSGMANYNYQLIKDRYQKYFDDQKISTSKF